MKLSRPGTCSGFDFGTSLRHIAAQGLAALMHVLHLRTVCRRFVERRRADHVVTDGDVETVTEGLQCRLPHLLLGVGDVLTLTCHPHAVTLDRFGQDHRRLALVGRRLGIGRIDLVWIVAAAVEPPDILIGHIRHHLLQLGILAEEVFPGIGAALGLVGLIVAVHRLFHALHQGAVLVAGKQWIPVAAPDHLDDMPAGAAEYRFQLLDDLAIAAHRAIQPLQVAIDHEYQIIEPLTARQGDRPQGLRFVHLAITTEGPGPALSGIDHTPVMQITHEAGLIDRHQGTESHGDRGKLPETRHQPGMRVGRETVAIHFLAEAVQLIFAQPPFEKGAGIDPGCRVPLKKDQVAVPLLVAGAEKVIETHIIEGCARGEAGDMAAQFGGDPVGLHHHGHGIPADK